MKKSTVFTVLLSALTIAYMIFSLPGLVKNLRIDRIQPFYWGERPTEAVMLNIWHIESFEGGKNSRGSWLGARAKAFEKANERVYINVKVLTLEQADYIIKNGGALPDMISFGYGAFKDTKQFVSVDNSANIIGAVRASGAVGTDLYAVPYSMGGYILAYDEQKFASLNVPPPDLNNWDAFIKSLKPLKYERKLSKNKTATVYALLYGKDAFTDTAKAFAFLGSGIDNALLSPDAGKLKPAAAFEKYADNMASSILVGTQRDAFRIISRNTAGKMEGVKYIPLAGKNGTYTDLIQYIAVTTSCSNGELSLKFIDYLLSANVQKKLGDIGLFSVLNGCTGLYDDPALTALETALHSKLKVPNNFIN